MSAVVFALFFASTFALQAHFRLFLDPTYQPHGVIQYYNGSIVSVGGPTDPSAGYEGVSFQFENNTSVSFFTQTAFGGEDEEIGDIADGVDFYGSLQALTDNEMFARVYPDNQSVDYYTRRNVYGVCPDFFVKGTDDISYQFDNLNLQRRLTGTLDTTTGFCVVNVVFNTTLEDNSSFKVQTSVAATEAAFNAIFWNFVPENSPDPYAINITLYEWTPNTVPNQRYSYVVGNATQHELALIPAEVCTPVCENGGTCQNGTCFCPGEYVNVTCNTPVSELNTLFSDSCDPECENNGLCQNSVCYCAGGYYGNICNMTIDDLLKSIEDAIGVSSVTAGSGVLALLSLFAYLVRM